MDSANTGANMMKTASQLDRDANRETAFRTFEDLCRQVRTGYTPTIPGHTAAQRRLRVALVQAGLRVFPAQAVR
jgi:hypothetical protein